MPSPAECSLGAVERKRQAHMLRDSYHTSPSLVMAHVRSPVHASILLPSSASRADPP